MVVQKRISIKMKCIGPNVSSSAWCIFRVKCEDPNVVLKSAGWCNLSAHLHHVIFLHASITLNAMSKAQASSLASHAARCDWCLLVWHPDIKLSPCSRAFPAYICLLSRVLTFLSLFPRQVLNSCSLDVLTDGNFSWKTNTQKRPSKQQQHKTHQENEKPSSEGSWEKHIAFNLSTSQPRWKMGVTGGEDNDAGNKDKNRRKPFPLLKNNLYRTLWKNGAWPRVHDDWPRSKRPIHAHIKRLF